MTSASELRSGKTHRDENFPVASWIIHPRHRALILAFYNFVRTADDIADHATLGERDKLDYLDLLEAELLGHGDSQPEAVNLRRALAERAMLPRHALDVLTAFRTGARTTETSIAFIFRPMRSLRRGPPSRRSDWSGRRRRCCNACIRWRRG